MAPEPTSQRKDGLDLAQSVSVEAHEGLPKRVGSPALGPQTQNPSRQPVLARTGKLIDVR